MMRKEEPGCPGSSSGNTNPNRTNPQRRGLRLGPSSPPELFRSHSAASQKTLEEYSSNSNNNNNNKKASLSSSGSRRRDRASGGEDAARADPAAAAVSPPKRGPSGGGQLHHHHQNHHHRSLSTLRTQSLRIGDHDCDDDGSASFNESKTSVNYDGAFENEPGHCRIDQASGDDDDGEAREYNASVAATGSSYDVSTPFSLANSPNGKGGGGGGRLPAQPNSDSCNRHKPSSPWRRLCCGGCRSRRTHDDDINSEGQDLSLKSHLWIQFGIFRDLCGRIVNDPKVELFIILLIVANAVVMGVATFGFVTDSPAVTQGFEVADRAFLIVFTIESALQLIYHGIHLFSDGWLLFDFVVVLLSWSLESMQVVRAFRIFRCIRLIARLEVLKNLVLSIFAVAPSMSAILMLLILILYVYAVMCTQLFGTLYQEGYTEVDYFSTLFLSLFTLFSMMTLEWGSVVRQVMVYNYWSCILFNSFIVLTSFILYSLIIAVVCDAVKVTEHHDEMRKHVEEKEEARQRVFALEHRVADMAQHQGAIVEQLQLALKELALLRRDDDNNNNATGEHENSSGSESFGNDADDDHELAVHDVWGSCERSGDERFHATETTLSATSACPSSPSSSSRRNNHHHYSSGNSMALSAVFSQDSSSRHHSYYRDGGGGGSGGRLGASQKADEGDLGTTCHAVAAAPRRDADEEDESQGRHDDADTTSHHYEGEDGGSDDVHDDEDARSLDLAAMHRRYAAS
jgi:Ion transport protein